MRKNCRIWWPEQLSSKEPPSCSLLFGWFVSCSPASLDIVVAFTFDQASFPSLRSGLEEILHSINGIMHTSLQDKSTFSLLGQCAANLNNDEVSNSGVKEKWKTKSGLDNSSTINSQDQCRPSYGKRRCGCQQLDLLVDGSTKAITESSVWIQLMYDRHGPGKKNLWIPKLHHIHWDGQIVSECDLHVCHSL